MSSPKKHNTKRTGTVVALQHTHPEQALEGLNRVTGLNFARWPESLVPAVSPPAEAQDDAEFAAERVTCNGTPR